MQLYLGEARRQVKQILQEELVSKRGALPSTDQSYERIMVRVGTAMLNEHLPQILPYLVGSKFLHRSEDNSFAAAFFVFDVAGLILDIPIFLINGSVKGYELLYVRDSKIFLPSLVEVLDFLKSQQQEKSGEPSVNESANRLRRATVNSSIYSPNNRFLTNAKSAGMRERLLDEAVDSFRSIMEEADVVFTKHGSLFEPNDWLTLLKHRGVRNMCRKLAEISPSFEQRFANTLNCDDWVESLNQYDCDLSVTIKSATFDRSNELSRKKFLTGVPKAIKPYVRINDVKAASKVAGVMEAKAEHDKFGACFFESGEAEMSKQAFITTRPNTYGTPTSDGPYQIFLLDGSKKRLFVYLRESVRSYTDSAQSLVIDADSGAIARVYTHEICADLEADADVNEYAKGVYGKDLPKLTSSVRLDEPMIALFPDGTVYGPFEVTSIADDPSGAFRIHNCHVASQGRHMGIGNNSCGTRSFNVEQLVIPEKDISRPRIMELGDRTAMFVPKETKILYVSEKPADRDYYRVKQIDVLPCSQMEQQELLKRASFSLEPLPGPYCRLDNTTMTKADAIEKLACFGLTIGQCKDLVSRSGKRESYIVSDADATLPMIVAGRKVAYTIDYNNMHNDYSYASPDEMPEGVGGNQIPIREVYDNEQYIPTDSQNYADTGASPWSSEQSPYTTPVVGGGGEDNQVRDAADAMSQNPEQLFENAAFVNMVNYVNPAVEREKLIEACIKSCTGVGRSYFLLLVHGDEFAEAYGLGDAEQLAGVLLTQLQGAGKILVKLFSRSISAGSDLALTTISA